MTFSTSRGGDHLGLLDARWREQQVDTRGIAPQDRGEIALGDAVGRQLQDGWGRIWDAKQSAQVAELEVAIDEHDAHARHLPE